jgi:tetratricopeptide (TPR) repeat protein
VTVTPAGPGHAPRPWVALTALLLSCGCSEGSPDPPAPALDGVEPQVVAKVTRTREAVLADPSPTQWARYARVLQAHGLLREALDAYAVAAPGLGASERFEAIYLAALAAAEIDTARAIRTFEEAAALRADYAPLHVRAGWLHEIAGGFDDAERHFERARALAEAPHAHPRVRSVLWPALVGLGRVAIARGNAPQAIRLLERARSLAPDRPQVHAALAIAYARAGRNDDAGVAGRRAGDDHPTTTLDDPIAAAMLAEAESTVVLEQLGLDALGNQQYAAAVAWFDRVLAGAPGHLGATRGKAGALVGLQRFADAEPLLDRVLATRPDDAEALAHKGLCALTRDERGLAAALFERALEADPATAIARLGLARLARQDQRLADAERHLRVLLERNPRAVGARLELASVLAESQKTAEALRELRLVLDVEPENEAALALERRLKR